MRNATILMVRLKGVATEAIKNIVLAGIGKLVVVDPDDVVEQDLGAGFFYRDEDVGKKVRRQWGPARAGSVRARTGPRVLSDPAGPSSYVVYAAEALSGSQRREFQRRRGWAFQRHSAGFPIYDGTFPGALGSDFHRRKARTQSLSSRERSWRVWVHWALTFTIFAVWTLRTVGTHRAPVLRSFSSHCHERVWGSALRREQSEMLEVQEGADLAFL